MTAPYCQHLECHNPHTTYYADGTSTRSNSDTRPWLPDHLVVSWEPTPGARRWCRSHALIFEGWAFG